MSNSIGWIEILTAALGGGITVKALDILYQEVRRRSQRKDEARRFLDDHLDPVLKASDELVGKLRALAENDFGELHNINQEPKTLDSAEFASLLYLFSRFWARIEIIRRQSLFVATGEDTRGRRLQDFLYCLESRRVRIIDRIAQRAVGEVMVETRGGALDTVSFVEFVRAYETAQQVRRWLRPLVIVLCRMRHTHERQRVLQYGVVLHALVDTLDPKHLVTRDRPSYPNKLTRRSWRDLKYRVFGLYLTFVADSAKYLGPPKRRPRLEKAGGAKDFGSTRKPR